MVVAVDSIWTDAPAQQRMPGDPFNCVLGIH
jgi:hypothetical protein